MGRKSSPIHIKVHCISILLLFWEFLYLDRDYVYMPGSLLLGKLETTYVPYEIRIVLNLHVYMFSCEEWIIGVVLQYLQV